MSGIGQSLLHPPVLFFFLGMLASAVRSNLRVPEALTNALSLYLLWAIGFRGGVELAAHGIGGETLASLGAAAALAVAVPLWAFVFLRRRVPLADAAAISATYGSVSAVTFMTASSVLERQGIPFGGHMVAAMVLMESPAIVMGVILLRLTGRGGTGTAPRVNWKALAHESFLNGPVLLLVGSLIVGVVTGERGYQAFKPLCTDLFNGVLVFFLLELGLTAGDRLRDLRGRGVFLIGFALAMPLFNAGVAIGLGWLLGLGVGNAVLLTVLAASASYIAVPAAVRLMIPEANAGLYLPMALAITFPFNIAIGIPLYTWAVEALR